MRDNFQFSIRNAILKAVSLILLVTMSIYSYSQDRMLTVKQMSKDLNELKSFIEAHPDPWRHISKSEFNKLWKTTKDNLNQPTPVIEFYKAISPLITRIKDGHSSIYLPKDYLEHIIKKQGAIPFKLYLTNDNKLYVIKKYDNNEIPLGSEIVKINGITIDSFIQAIDPFTSYEKKSFRNTIIDSSPNNYMLLAFGRLDSLQVEYFSQDTLTTLLTTIPFKAWKAQNKLESKHEVGDVKFAKHEPYSYKVVKDGIGLLTIHSFHASSLSNYNIFLRKAFKNIRRDSIHSLIIDIRGNFGGWPKISSGLFHYISNGYFKTLAKSDLKASSAFKSNLYDRYPALRQIKTYIEPRRHYVDIRSVLQSDPGTIITETEWYNEKPERKEFEFNGDCYLLQNRDSYSAASCFASTFQCYLMGEIIGEETGGTKVLHANAIYHELGRSNIFISMSTTKLFTTCYSPDEEFNGVVPNIPFSPTILDLCNDADTHLYYAIRLINKKRKKILKEE